MIGRIDHWQEQLAETLTGTDYDRYRDDLRALREKRWLMNRRLIEQAQATLRSSLTEPIAQEIQRYNERWTLTVSAAAQDDYPTP
jgi:hypothetical protein